MIHDTVITVLRFSPGKNPEIAELENSVKAICKEISQGSYYQCDAVTLELEPGIHVVYNEEAPLLGLEGNRRILDKIIAGTFLIVATDNKDNIVSLTSRMINKYGIKYWNIEEYTNEEVSHNYFYAPFEAYAL